MLSIFDGINHFLRILAVLPNRVQYSFLSLDNGMDGKNHPPVLSTTNTKDISTTKTDPPGPPTPNTSSIVDQTEDSTNSISKVNPDLSQLSVVISPDTLPTAEQSAQFLTDLTTLKTVNAERDHLQLLDMIIDMTDKGEIGDMPLNKSIPDSIVVLHRDGLDAYEYINAQVTKKWIEYKFQTETSQLEISVRTPHLVQITDKAKGRFDVMGLLVKHTSRFIRNRISPEYYAKNERLVPEPPPVVPDYSAFRGHYSVVKRSAPPPPGPSSLVKVFVKYYLFSFNLFHRHFLRNITLLSHIFKTKKFAFQTLTV